MRVVVIGAGDVGAYLARVLSKQGSEVILLDRSSEALARAEEEVDALALQGDATFRHVLTEAQVKRADLVIAVTGSDDTNLVAAALASSVGARRTVARVDAPGFYAQNAGIEQHVLGVHSVLCASRLVSAELLRLVRTLDVTYVGNLVGNAVQVCLVPVTDDAPVAGKAVASIKVESGAGVRGVVRDGALRGPETVSQLEAGDALLMAGPPSGVTLALSKIRAMHGRRRAVVVGGGDVGFHLAETLSQSERRVQVIERDRDRCTFLAERLTETNVIHGDGTSMSCLRDEQVDTADYLLAVTRADEVNLMVTLMGAHLGVDRTFALVHRPGYSDVYAQLGIQGTAGAHDVIARTVDWLLPHPGALVRQSLAGTGHEIIELVVPAKPTRSMRVSELPMPQGALLVGIARSLQSIVPDGHGDVKGGDHLIIAAPSGSVNRVERRIRGLGKDAPA
jgi:trk system potassium uptake protein TrkA